ncbi:MAG: hypothetical protein HBSAPP04_00310 [Ignavibacteriaceae bacterium]|nr:MAG: hypothetical protein HBSAPP04_00310 [Ignavibacteriaceae bacterium]
MKIAFFAAHPSQYYIFRELIRCLPPNYQPVLICYEKDVLRDLLENDKLSIPYYLITDKKKNKHFRFAFAFVKKIWSVFKLIKQNRIDVIFGSSITLIFAAKMSRIPSVIFTEDDIGVINLSAKLGYPWVDFIISPKICNLGRYDNKSVRYDGYQKLAYLHPSVFKTDGTILRKYLLNPKANYFLLRFSALSAHHDIGVTGISIEFAEEIINVLRLKGEVLISSERNLPSHLECLRIKINPLDLHQLLASASILISDSQSMSVEASILGVPSIRISSLVGKISVLEELEHKYKLTFGFVSSERERILNKIGEIIESDNTLEFQRRRNRMLNEKVDVNKFFVDFIKTEFRG